MLKVLGDRVLVLLEATPPDVVTESGILLQRDPDYRKVPTRGIVAQLGDKTGMCKLDDVLELVYSSDVALHDIAQILTGLEAMRPAPFDVAVGEMVIFSPGDGEEVELDGQTYVILREAEILGVVNKIPKYEAV